MILYYGAENFFVFFKSCTMNNLLIYLQFLKLQIWLFQEVLDEIEFKRNQINRKLYQKPPLINE